MIPHFETDTEYEAEQAAKQWAHESDALDATRTTAREPETKHQPHDAAAVVAGHVAKESA